MLNYTTLEESKIEFVEIAPASELPNGERLFVELEDKPIVIFNIAGHLFAIGDVCSHDDGPLGDGLIEDHNIVCPRHGGEFERADGAGNANACRGGYPCISRAGKEWDYFCWNTDQIKKLETIKSPVFFIA